MTKPPHPHQPQGGIGPAVSPFTGKPDCVGFDCPDATAATGIADGADAADNPSSSQPPANPGESAPHTPAHHPKGGA